MTEPEPRIDVRILDHPVAWEALEKLPDQAGGECVFLGRTRRDVHPEHGPLEQLCYEAYRPMAQQTLTELARAAVERFGCCAVRIHHALGEVPPGDASVLVQVACGHRAEAIDACRFLIDALKRSVPIW